jgi:hypothetical protein
MLKTASTRPSSTVIRARLIRANAGPRSQRWNRLLDPGESFHVCVRRSKNGGHGVGFAHGFGAVIGARELRREWFVHRS